MTAYTDVLQANRLIEEQTRLIIGIATLDAGGTVSAFTIAPALPEPGPMVMGAPSMSMMLVAMQTIDPPPELMAAARAAMVDRHNKISAELETMGVTGAPPMTA